MLGLQSPKNETDVGKLVYSHSMVKITQKPGIIQNQINTMNNRQPAQSVDPLNNIDSDLIIY